MPKLPSINANGVGGLQVVTLDLPVLVDASGIPTECQIASFGVVCHLQAQRRGGAVPEIDMAEGGDILQIN